MARRTRDKRTRDKRTDDEWVAALRGDLGQRAQEAAYKDLVKYLYKVTYNCLCSRRDSVPGLSNKSNDELAELAEDLAQDTLVSIAQKRLYNAFRGESKFTSYVAAVAINVVKQLLRHKEWWVYTEPLPPPEREYDVESGEGLPPLEPELSPELTPETWQLRREIWDIIRRCVEQLPERWRRAFVLTVFEDLSAARVRELMEATSEQAIYNLVNRARGRLKKCLGAAGWDPDDIGPLFK